MKCIPCDKNRVTGTIFSLCLAAATHSFLLFSFFPYAGYMSVGLLNNNDNNNNNASHITVDNVGIYAGMLGAVFTFGRFLGFVPWKIVRNRLGGKHALMLSLFLTGAASMWVGLASTFASVLAARFAQGISNCISGCVKRAAINARHNLMSERASSSNININSSIISNENPEEIAHGDAQALVLSIMWWGTALGPIVGGLLSDPRFLKSSLGLELEDGWYASYPYLLPNAFSAILCWLSMTCVAVFTKGQPHRRVATTENTTGTDVMSRGETRPLLSPPISTTATKTTTGLWVAFLKLWRRNKEARYHLIAYWSFSFVVVCCDEALPLFLITKQRTGLGLSEGQVGGLLSAAGLIVAICHHAALERLFDIENGSKDGMYRILSVGAVLGNVPAVLIPLSLLLNGYSDSSKGLLGLTLPSFLYLVVLVAFLRGSASLYFSFIGMATGQTLRVVHKDEAARIMTMGALFVRSLAPIIAGAVLSHFMSSSSSSVSTFRSSWMIWIIIGLLFGLAAATMSIALARQSGNGVISDKQRMHIANRLERANSIPEVWERYYDLASKSICSGWENKTCFRRARNDATSVGNTIGNDDEIGRPTRRNIATWKDHTVAPGVDFDKVSFFIIGTHKNDQPCCPHVLTPPIMNALQKYLPTNCKERNFWLKYSLLRDGASTHSLEVKSGLGKYTVMAIETLKGDVFGCFMTEPLMSTNNQYARSGESFLWRLKKRRSVTVEVEEESEALAAAVVRDDGASSDDDDIIDVYPYTGENDLCMLFAHDKIACGGGIVDGTVGTTGDGFGIVLADDLFSGSSSPCRTYDNPCLLSSTSSASLDGEDENENGRFEVANIEIWNLTPFMFMADAERSEKSLRVIKDNEFVEGESPSSTSPWSNFL